MFQEFMWVDYTDLDVLPHVRSIPIVAACPNQGKRAFLFFFISIH
jgi:hypothetical protein